MHELLIKIGKDFCTDQWGITFCSIKEQFTLFLKEGFDKTIPFPGAELDINDIHNLVVFLSKELKERLNEQSNLE